jgi:hypothetical protein
MNCPKMGVSRMQKAYMGDSRQQTIPVHKIRDILLSTGGYYGARVDLKIWRSVAGIFCIRLNMCEICSVKISQPNEKFVSGSSTTLKPFGKKYFKELYIMFS